MENKPNESPRLKFNQFYITEMQSTNEDSLRNRYASKLLTSIIGLPLGILSQTLITRGLGPSAFGDFNFLTDFFSKFIGFFNSGTSMGFYVKLSQRQKDYGMIRFYWSFITAIALIIILGIAVILLFGLEPDLWPGQSVKYVWMAFVYGLLVWISEIAVRVVDAHGLTRQGEMVRLLQRFIGVLMLLPLFYLHRLDLGTLFLYQYVVTFLLVGLWWFVLQRNGIRLFPIINLPWAQLRKYAAEFYQYSSPLMAQALAALIAGVLDRWLLQKFAGSAEQGFYGLSYQIAAICFLFTGAMTPLFTREFSIAHHEKDMTKMRHYFQRFIPMLYAIAAFFAVFLMFQADKVAEIMGGNRFRGAGTAIAIMALYPIHQTYGQLTGAVFFATGQTKLYRNVGVAMLVLSLPVTYFLLAPQELFGLNLASTGLALKMVLVQFISANILLWHNCKFLQLSFWKFFAHQFYLVFLLGIAAYVSGWAVDLVTDKTLIQFLAAGAAYLIIVTGLLFLFPSFFSTSTAELFKFAKVLKSKVSL